MKKVRFIFALAALLAVFNACQKDFDLKNTPKPSYDLVYANYDPTSVDSVLCFMDPVYYNQVYKRRDSLPIQIGAIQGFYADRAPTGDGWWRAHCAPCPKTCLVIHGGIIPAYQCPELQNTFGYDPSNLEYSDFLVICRDEMPQLIQGKYENLVLNENQSTFTLRQINQKIIIFDGNELAGQQ